MPPAGSEPPIAHAAQYDRADTSPPDGPAAATAMVEPMTNPQPPAVRKPARAWRRLTTLALAVGVLLVWGGGVASAHVTVNPNTATPGSYAKLTFRVPTESATATTVKLTVKLPTDHPFPSVSVMPVPGWSTKVTTSALNPPVTEGRFNLTEALSSITWTADDGVGIKLDEFMEFAISVGPVPDVPSMTFPADQTYSDGSVVSWNQVAKTGSTAELDHPAPVLTIAAATTDGPSGISWIALILAIVAVALGAVAVAVAVTSARRSAVPAGAVASGGDEAADPQTPSPTEGTP